MGLGKAGLDFIVKEHKRKAFTGPILTLGRQGVHATLEEVQQILITENITPAILSPNENTMTNIPSWIKAGPPYTKYTNDIVFFKLLGFTDVQAMDYSNFEGADILHNLNNPIPRRLKNRFDLIIDGGTIEHVFDIKQNLMNIGMMLKPGGRIIHQSPMNNFVNHGFYQLSPTFFFDYYAANAFVNLRGYFINASTDEVPQPWKTCEITPTTEFTSFNTSNQWAVFFVAEKMTNSTVNKVPLQSLYQQTYQQETPCINTQNSASKAISGKAILNRLISFDLNVFISKILSK